jgi:hypothetical protein
MTNGTVFVTVTPRPNVTGTETITITVSDGENVTRTSFEFEVRSENDSPVIAPIADISTPEDVSVTVRLTISDEETPLDQLTITGVASNTNLVSGVVIQNAGGTVQATINLVTNASGTSVITIRANDGTNTTTATFDLTVIPVPECPVLAPIPNQTVNSGAATHDVVLNVSDPDTAVTDLTFLSAFAGNVVQNIQFFASGNAAAAQITLRPGVEGTERITFTVSDGECIVRQSFDLTVAPATGIPATLAVSRTGTNLTINVSGTPGASYTIEASVNLMTWSQIRIVEIEPDGATAVTVPINTRYTFFRARAAAGGQALSDVTQPGDTIALVNGTNDGDSNAGAPPANEGVERVIDNAGQKYLNFLDLGSGFTVTPSVGSTVLVGLTFWPANDAAERDPASYRLEGSNDGTTFNLISEGPLTLMTNRNPGGFTALLSGTNFVTVSFQNSTSFTSYRVIFPTLRNAATANSMQIAEVDLIGRLQ